MEDEFQVKLRRAAHAGAAYAADAETLREQLAGLFLADDGPGLLPWEGLEHRESLADDRPDLLGVMSPHIDYARGGAAYGWAYDRLLSETTADLFIILATAHQPLRNVFNVGAQDFGTPLGTARCGRHYVGDLHARLAKYVGNERAALSFDDPQPHAEEHSIELQAVMLQFILGGRRDFQIVPILVDSFYPFVLEQRQPDTDAFVADFIRALHESIAASGRQVCFVGSVDLAHIGPLFGDEEKLTTDRLKKQWTDDQRLLATACAADAAAWFDHVSARRDQNRVCGLAPMYVMLEAMKACRGELLKYDQAAAEDHSACVSFASVAFYGDK